MRHGGLPGLRQPAHPAAPRPSTAPPTAGPRSAHVERTFGWMIRWRRLVRDYEKRLDVSEAMIELAMGALLLRRIAHP
ncbi:MAG: transposase [Acetobacteraceae bacterium]|nr:transposase [Acetobacteraceae bacterium]